MLHNTVEYVEGDQPVPGLRLVQFLGTGAFGEVWKAVRSGETECAVKIVRFDEPKGRREFRGLQRVKRVHHPNLVRIHAFWLKGWDGGILEGDPAAPQCPQGPHDHRALKPLLEAEPHADPYGGAQARELIVEMDLCEQTLFDRLQECRARGLDGIPVDELLPYLAEAAKALDYLNHPSSPQDEVAAAVQHCDVKPQNIMLVGGSVQICDFGLVRDVGRMPTSPDAAATLAYVAPELMAEGTPSQATDQYSLAVTYYELRTSRLPYPAETLAAITQAVLTGELDFSAVSPAEGKVLRRATARRPNDRYPSCQEMVDALKAAAAGIEPPAAPRRWRQLVVAGVLVASIAGATALWYGPASPPATPPAIAPSVPLPPLEPPSAEVIFQHGLELAREGRFPEAIVEIRRAISLEPGLDDRPEYGNVLADHGKALLEEAIEKSGNGEDAQAVFDQAAEVLQEAVRRNRANPDAWSRLGVLYSDQGHFDDAVEAFGKAIELRPQDAQEYVNRGEAYRLLKNPELAIKDLSVAVELDPAHGAAHYALARAYFSDKKFAEAVSHFDAALTNYSPVDRDSYTPGLCHLLRGLCCCQLDGIGAARADFEALLKQPDGVTAALFHQVAALYREEKLYDEAARFEEQALGQLEADSPLRNEYEEALRSDREQAEKTESPPAPPGPV